MGYTHHDKISGINGLAVGKKDLEIVVASSTGQLYQSGTAITSTASELNVLDGVTASATELNLIDGSIVGTAVASKAAVLGADKNLDTIAIADGGLKLGAGAGTAVTATAAELNLIDGSIAGTSVISKALVLGTNKNVDVLAVADLKLGSGAGTSVAPTAAQINLLAQGVAAGYKIARGTLTPATASDTVATGLTTVVAAVASLRGAPSLTHMFNAADIGNQAGTPAAGSILIKSYKPTGAADVTPIAATTPWVAVDWIAIGT